MDRDEHTEQEHSFTAFRRATSRPAINMSGFPEAKPNP